MIGRELYPLMTKAGYEMVRVSPRMVYVDSSKPQLGEGFTKKTFTAMIEGVHAAAVTTSGKAGGLRYEPLKADCFKPPKTAT